MNKIVRGFLYGLAPIAIFLLILFFLAPQRKDNPYMKIYTSSDGKGFSGCEFLSEKDRAVLFRFDMAPEECRLVYFNGDVLSVSVEYPRMKLVGSQVGDSVITFTMFHVSTPPYDIAAVFEGISPVRVSNGMAVYDIGGREVFRFSGDDGTEVAVGAMNGTFIAKRLFKGLRVSYRYEKADGDFKNMDDFALRLLKRILLK